MKLTKTGFKLDINKSSSWIIYITQTWEEAEALHKFAITQREMLISTSHDWYYTVSSGKVVADCRVPKVFHNRGYYVTAIEHNNGDWNAEQKYELYIAE